MKNISIIIPAYNEEDSLDALLKKLNEVISSRLSGYNVEVIIVDDHSTDTTREIIKRGVSLSLTTRKTTNCKIINKYL